ncbi:MAG: hypothetical protein QOJ10_22, partial [Chloroflexota bacterium]|nr:hypothetical protein [Chloroflexota bacterium]
FARTHCLGRSPELLVGPRLDLDYNKLRSAPADQVELAAPGPEAGSDHLIAPPSEEIRRRLLAGTAEL